VGNVAVPSERLADATQSKDAERSDATVLRSLASLSAGINRGRAVDETLQELVESVVRHTGFGVAALNVVLPNGDLQVAAVSGPDDVREQLTGHTAPRTRIDDLLACAEHWGELRFVPHGVISFRDDYEWIPDIPVSDDPNAWHPEDSMLAPLYGSEGALVGVLSVDLPPGLRKPNSHTCELLEMYAIQAGIAIDNARLVAELRRERDRLAASEAAYRFLFTESAGAMGIVSLDAGDMGRVLQVNDALVAVFGAQREELEGRTWTEFVIEQERPASRAKLAAIRDGSLERADRQMLRPDGSMFWASLKGTAVPTGEGSRTVCLVHVDDVTDRKAREVELARQANADPLTGLANRRAFLRRLDSVVSHVDPAHPSGALVYADLNDFKDVNDSFGHAVGDLVLKEAAARLVAETRSGDVVTRIGGDEFAIVAVGLDAQHAENLLARVRIAFARPMTSCPDGRPVTVSLGWVPLSGPPQDAADVLHLADKAMFIDKAVQRGPQPASS
jgi:diguanylate cyclase (GGDEF)-like protein/PAS domain S-box-containing protein